VHSEPSELIPGLIAPDGTAADASRGAQWRLGLSLSTLALALLGRLAGIASGRGRDDGGSAGEWRVALGVVLLAACGHESPLSSLALAMEPEN